MADEKNPTPTSTPDAPSAASSGDKKTFVEEVEVAGDQLVDRMKRLLADANAKRVIVRSVDGDELMTLPLTFGVVAGGLITFAAPLLAALGALAALVSRVKLEVIREAPEDEADRDDAPVSRA